MVKHKELLKSLEAHLGWRILREWLDDILKLNNQALLDNYFDKHSGQDKSDIIRGKIMMLSEITRIQEAITEYEQLVKDVATNKE